MANIAFSEQENRNLHPSALKMRQRLQSAPGTDSSALLVCFFSLACDFAPIENVLFFPPEKLSKSPMTAKISSTPLPTGRKAFGAVNKTVSTPALNPQEKKILKPQVTTYNKCDC